MHQFRSTTAGLTAAQALNGSTAAFDVSTHHSEGTPSMARQQARPRTHATVRALAGGGVSWRN